jgi:transcriptional regulator with XRE-family HTH domain
MSKRRAGPTDAIVGGNIRVQRLARDMSQSDLASKMGITFQQVQKYEKGTNRVGSGRLMRIAEVFGLPITALFVGAAPSSRRKPKASATDLIAARGPMRLVKAFARIKERRVRHSIISLVESIAAKSVQSEGPKERNMG